MMSSQEASNVQEVDELLANEMSRMSVQERWRMEMEVKGKNMLAAIEPAQLVSLGLKALDEELRTMKNRKYYDKAISLNSTMVTSEEFRLKFARATAFDPVKAADRIENHLEVLYKHFGEHGMLRPIQLSDLDKIERDLLKSGSNQILPCRDKAGRRILARLGVFGTSNHTTTNKVRVSIYMMQVFSEDEETQKQGVVILHWPLLTDYTTRDIGPLWKVAMFGPVRISAFHFCLKENQRLAAVTTQTILLACPELQARCRIHIGSITECQYALMTYGISPDYIPITNTGNVKTQNHQKWIAYREEKEYALRERIPFDGIDCPSVNDVLAGKGPHISNHPGNVMFRKIMESQFEEHRDATVIDRKTAITWEVVQEVQRHGARFLVKDKGWWRVANQDTAREKVSVAFRDMRKSFATQEKLLRKKRIEDEREGNSDVKKLRVAL